MSDTQNTPVSRRTLLKDALRGAGLVGVAAVTIGALNRSKAAKQDWVWQIDPHKCVQCGRCATACVLTPSAVKCVHSYEMCGYCKLCTGYFDPQPNELTTAAENQQCPTNAIIRTFIEDPYYEYSIDEDRCIGCGKCVAGCGQFGNGSLYLQIIRTRCKNCNDCTIAAVCKGNAISRIPLKQGYLLKNRKENLEETEA